MNTIKFGLLFFALFSNSIGFCYENAFDSEEYIPTAGAVINFSRNDPEISKLVNITVESFKKAAVIGLINYRWKVTKITDNQVEGVLKEKYKARILLKKDNRQNTIVRIYVSGPTVKQNWVDNIHREMVAALILLSN